MGYKIEVEDAAKMYWNEIGGTAEGRYMFDEIKRITGRAIHIGFDDSRASCIEPENAAIVIDKGLLTIRTQREVAEKRYLVDSMMYQTRQLYQELAGRREVRQAPPPPSQWNAPSQNYTSQNYTSQNYTPQNYTSHNYTSQNYTQGYGAQQPQAPYGDRYSTGPRQSR